MAGSAIERIRAEVEEVRKEHVSLNGQDGRICSAHGCYYLHPECPTLQLAEDKLKLAEALEKLLRSAVPHPNDHPTMTSAWAAGRAALAEAAR